MAEGKIRVKFEEKDSDKLISAIKALNVETKKLSGQSAKYEKQTKKTDKANVNLRNNTKILGASFLGFGNILTQARAKLLLYAFAVNQASQVVNNLVRTNANIEDMSRAFNNLSKSAGFSSDTFDKLNEAVDGTVRKTNLMQQANNAMLLGIFESSDQMAEMFDVAQRLGQALGRTAGESIESLVTGLGRQSKLMLDNLGIVFDTNQAYEEYAKELEKNSNALTDQEKKQAFVNKAVAIANDLVRQSGDEILGTNAKLDQLSVSFENFQANIGEAITPVVIFATEILKDLMDSIDVEEIKSYSAGFASVASAVGLYNIAIALATIRTTGFTVALTKTGIGSIAVGFGLAVGALLDYMNVFKDVIKIQEQFAESNKLTNETQNELTEEQEKSIKSLQKKLDILNAVNEIDKMRIEIGRDLTEKEKELIVQIQNKKNEMQFELDLQNQIAEKEKNRLTILNESLDIRDRITVLNAQINGASQEEIELLKSRIEFESKLEEIGFGIMNGQTIQLDINKQFSEVEIERLNLLFTEFDLLEKLIKRQKELKDIQEAQKDGTLARVNATSQLLGALSSLASKDKDTAILGMRLSAGATIASGIAGAAKAFQRDGVAGFLTGTAMLIQTMARVQTINAQIRSLQSEKFEQGGLVGGRRHSQGGTMIEAERGEFVMSRNAVSAIGVENLNRMNQGQSSGGGSINININGGMISPDFVENELAESIREAVRRGADFGIS